MFSKGQDVIMVMLQRPVFRILRGKSQFPLRAIDTEQFLLGAGNSCQLQVSAGEIPIIYAIVHRNGADCRIEAMHPHPPLLINGVAQQSASLLPGDRVSFGPYEMEFLLVQVEHELQTVAAEPAEIPGMAQEWGTIIPELPNDIAALSAEELVDRIEQELALLDEFGHYDDPEQVPLKTPRKSA